MGELILPPGSIGVLAICRVCKKPVRVAIDEELNTNEDPTFQKLRNTLLEWAAHDECVDALAADRREQERQQVKKEALRARLELWGRLCPPEFLKPIDFTRPGARQDNFDAIMAWRHNPKGLIILGASGHCKTRFAYALLKREHLAGRKVMAVTHIEFRQKVTTLSQTEPGKSSLFNWACMKAQIWLLDDLGKANTTPASEEALAEVIDYRTKHGLPIIATTNNSFAQLQEKFSGERGKPMLRRLTDYCTELPFQ